VHYGLLFCHKEEYNYIICKKMYVIVDDQVKKNKPDSERQILHVFSHRWNLPIKNYMNVKGEVFGEESEDLVWQKQRMVAVNKIEVYFIHVWD
jgi:hypothetical protein